VLLTPTPGSVLPATSSSVAFAWTSGLGATQYWLDVGATPGGHEYYSASTGTALSATAPAPVDGRTIYVRLWSLIAGSWQFNDYTYTAGTGLIGVLTTPAPQSSLPGSSGTFSWTPGAGATQYWLYVGTTIGGVDYYNSSTGTNLSALVNGLPTDGRVLYVRLYSLVSGVWLFNDYTYRSGPGLTAPVSQSALAGASVTFSWSAGTGVTQYWLAVSGTSLNGTELYNQSTGAARSASVSGLPTDGRTIYVRLWYLVGGNWLFSDYLYTASGGGSRARMTAPAPGLTLAGTSQAFAWSASNGASQYWLTIGSSVGGSDLYNQSTGTSLSATVSNLPTDGRILYVRLWFLSGTTWLSNDFVYFAAKGP
jgi:serine protease